MDKAIKRFLLPLSWMVSSPSNSMSGGHPPGRGAIGGAEGVGQNLATAEIEAQLITRHNLTWDDAFSSSLSGAISGVFQSSSFQNGFDSWISTSNWDWHSAGDEIPSLLQGVSSNVIGGAISTFTKDATSGNLKYLGADEISSFLGNTFGQIAHQSLQGINLSKIGINVLSNSSSALVQQIYSDIYSSWQPGYDGNAAHQFFGNFIPSATAGWSIDTIFQ